MVFTSNRAAVPPLSGLDKSEGGSRGCGRRRIRTKQPPAHPGFPLTLELMPYDGVRSLGPLVSDAKEPLELVGASTSEVEAPQGANQPFESDACELVPASRRGVAHKREALRGVSP